MNREIPDVIKSSEVLIFSQNGRGSSKQNTRLNIYLIVMITDVAALFSAFLIANYVRFDRLMAGPGFKLFVLSAPIYLALALNSSAFSAEIFTTWRRCAHRAIIALFGAAAAILFISFYLQASTALSRTVLSIGVALAALLLSVSRFAAFRLSRGFFDGPAVDRLVLLDEVEQFTATEDAEIVNVSALGLTSESSDPQMLDAWGRIFRGRDRVIVVCPPDRRRRWSLILKGANVDGEILMPEIAALGSFGARQFGDETTLLVSTGPLNLRSRAIKRGFDIFFSLLFLLAMLPVMAAVAIAIKLEDHGPIFFVQSRVGRGNTLFSILKFRSMRAESSDRDGVRSASRDDDRITRVGKLIRSTSIDELPQMINVLKGDMSIVGPRPHALGSLAGNMLFWEIDERYWHRHAAKPGLTGLAQVRGFRGATAKESDLTRRLQADLEYLNDWSLWRDIKILLSTVGVLVHRNAY
jgi:exopolysaccharide biosynthesis polyprenyl glycosylphosphotransferase